MRICLTKLYTWKPGAAGSIRVMRTPTSQLLYQTRGKYGSTGLSSLQTLLAGTDALT